MPDVADWLRSGVPAVQPLDEAALLRRVRAKRRRRRMGTGTFVLAVLMVVTGTGVVVASMDHPSADVYADEPSAPAAESATTTPASDMTTDLPIGPPDATELGVDPCAAEGEADAAASSLIRDFLDAVLTGEPLRSAAADVTTQVTSTRSTASLERFTQIGYRVVSADAAELCVHTYQRQEDSALEMSFDAVAAVLVDGQWTIVRWVRGAVTPVEDPQKVLVPFYGPGELCAPQGFLTGEVEIPTSYDTPAVLIYHALSEVLSGPAGRANAATAIPTDVRLVGTPVVELGTVSVEVSTTASDLDECVGRAARDQVAEAARLAAERADVADYQIVVVVNGQPVATLG